MEEKKDINVEALAKLISLTRNDKLSWTSVDPSEVFNRSPEDIISSVFVTHYKDKVLRIYQRKYKGPSIGAKLGAIFSSSISSGEMRWYTEVVLELINDEGHSLWSFPKEEILKDLLEVIKYKVSGASDLINSLLSD